MTRSYSDLKNFHTIEERFDYLALKGVVGRETFGFDRYMNQKFYRSAEWRQIRHHVIVRDLGCDLGVDGYEIVGAGAQIFIHHMNPITANDLIGGNLSVLDPEFLITVSFRTHNAVHYGDRGLLPKPMVERRPGDTKLW